MAALKPNDRALLAELEELANFEAASVITGGIITDALKLIRRLARHIDGPGTKNPGKRARQKGQELQRTVANHLKPHYPEAASNSQYRGARKDGADVEGTPYWIEAKWRKDGSVFTAYKQALRDKKAHRDSRPVLVATTRNNEPLIVAMHVSTFLDLLPQPVAGIHPDDGQQMELLEVPQ